MEKHFLDLKDERLTAETAPQAEIYAILGTESVSLLAVDAANTVLAVESWQYGGADKRFAFLEGNVRLLLKEAAIWSLPYGQRHGCLFHPQVTLVPRRLFQHGDLSGYFKLLLSPGDYVYAYEEIPEFDAYLLTATERAQANLFSDLFPQTRQRHLAAPLLRFVREMPDLEEHTIFLNLRHQMVQIIVMERQNLLFYNTFQFSAATDLLYSVLLVYDQFRLKPAEIPLLLAGDILQDSELYKTLYRFVRDLRFVVPPGLSQVPQATDTLPPHCLVDLFCLKKND